VTDDAVPVRRISVMRPDQSRVVTHLFVPGHEMAGGNESRASSVVNAPR